MFRNKKSKYSEYYVDVEYNRNNGHVKTIRLKKEKEDDRARLTALTRDSYDGVWSFDGKTLPEHVCGYDLGIYYEIDLKTRLIYIEYYVKGELVEKHKEKIA